MRDDETNIKRKKILSYMKRRKPSSISRNLTYSLVLTVIVVSTFFVVFNYFDASRKAKIAIENNADEYIGYITDILQIPMWNVNIDSIKHIGRTYFQNNLIVQLKVIDKKGNVLFHKEEGDNGPLIKRAGKVLRNGELLGNVEISLTSRYYKETNRRLLWSSIIIATIILLTLTIMTGIFLRMFLRKPLQRLDKIADSYAAGSYDLQKDQVPVQEFRQFVFTLGQMGEKITAQITELQKSKEKYHTLFETSNDAVLVMDTEDFLECNDQTLKTFGCAREDIIGQSPIKFSPLTQPDGSLSQESAEKKIEAAFHGVPQRFYWQHIRLDGSTFDAEVSLTPTRIASKAVVQAVVQDISERKRAEEKIKEYSENLEGMVEERTNELQDVQEAMLNLVEDLNKSKIELEKKALELEEKNVEIQEATETKSQFLANMSHELRTPLNAIIGFSEILSDKTFGELNEKQSKYTHNVLTSGRHLLQLINDILDLSKVEAGKSELEPSGMNIKSLLENSLIMIKEKALNHGIKLDSHISPEVMDLEIFADERKLKQIMFNLLSNAAKFTPDGGTITTSARRDGEDLMVGVADTGIGIKPEDQERVFSEFEQVDSTYARQQQGTGLGLALTRKLIELHGGRIWVESEGEGKGSTFTFVIPIRAEALAEKLSFEPEEPLSSRPHVDDSRPLVLVVEDDRQASELINQYLSEADYAVAQAFDGEQAIEMARELRPYAITLDILLPKKDGWEVLAELKSLPETKDIPVVILSITEDRLQFGLNLGAIEYFVKPVNKEQLIKAVRRAGAVFKKEKLTVLVVDDEPKTVELLTDELRAEGFDVLQAYGGQQGIDLAVEAHPDVIVLDLMMPEVSGFDVVRQLRAHPEAMEIPVLIFTAKDLTEEDRQKLEGHVQIIVSKSGSGKEDLLRELERSVKIKNGE